MNGAESLLRSAALGGLDICFANPGTTELSFTTAFDSVKEIRPVLCLTEGVCAGAADGYARMAKRPALTLLHLGPGLANALAYLHNARRAATPIINVVGEHSTCHLSVDAPLTSNIAALANPMCRWVRTCGSAESIPVDIAQAMIEARKGVVCLIVPANYQAAEVAETAVIPSMPPVAKVDDSVIDEAAKSLQTLHPSVLFLGGAGLSRTGLEAAARIAAATKCQLLQETFPARCERGGGLVSPLRLPYLPAIARETLAHARSLVLAGAREPVSFFGYPGARSSFVPEGCSVCTLAEASQDAQVDVPDALCRLADRLGKAARTPKMEGHAALGRLTGPLTPLTFAATVASCQPRDAIMVDESVTSGFAYHGLSAAAPTHTYLVPHVGGAIGHGLPLATGAALACPDRPVLLLEADGSGLYNVQALWTQAREDLNVTTIICANRAYRVLQQELGRNTRDKGGATDTLLNLDKPFIDWVQVAAGFGVPSCQTSSAEELFSKIGEALKESGPHLIEAFIED